MISLFSILFNFLHPHAFPYTVLVSTGKKLTYTEVQYLSMDMMSQSSTTVNFILLSVMPEYEDDDGSEEETVVHWLIWDMFGNIKHNSDEARCIHLDFIW